MSAGKDGTLREDVPALRSVERGWTAALPQSTAMARKFTITFSGNRRLRHTHSPMNAMWSRSGSDVPLLERLGPLPAAGIQTGAGAVMNALNVRPGTSFASFGAGAVGCSAIMAARAVGATTIVAIDICASRLEMAKELGATYMLLTVNRQIQLRRSEILPVAESTIRQKPPG